MRGLAQVLGVWRWPRTVMFRASKHFWNLQPMPCTRRCESPALRRPMEKRLTLVVDSILDLNERQPWALEVLLARELWHAEDMPNTTRVCSRSG